MSITQQPWGQTTDGIPVDLYTLTNANGVVTTVATYGGAVVSLLVPDRHGVLGDVVLGFDSLQPYLGRHPYFGVVVGRVANRTGRSRFKLNGRQYTITETHDEHHLHGGKEGFDRKVWQAQPGEGPDGPTLTLSYRSPDGEEGYPGDLSTQMVYRLTNDNALRIDYDAVPDQETVVNLTNHSYFNLAGQGDILDHVMTIDADFYTPMGTEMITNGEVLSVIDTPFDFRQPTYIGERIDADHPQIHIGSGYDHNYVLKTRRGEPPARIVEVYHPASGRVLETFTTESGVQFYTSNSLGVQTPVVGKGGQSYGKRAAFCLETQSFPNAINYPHFPSPIVRAGEHYLSTTIYKFSAR